jgi:hypothetical protein
MTELLCIALCIALTALVFYHFGAVNDAYERGREDNLAELEPELLKRFGDCYMAGIHDAVERFEQEAPKMARAYYIRGRMSVVDESIYQQN